MQKKKMLYYNIPKRKSFKKKMQYKIKKNAKKHLKEFAKYTNMVIVH